MLGDLFDGENEHNTSDVKFYLPNVKKSNNSMSRPLGARKATNFCGIINQGATCYLNTLLQTLFLTPEFRDGIFSLTPDELGLIPSTNGTKMRIIPIQLQRLFALLLKANQEACSTDGLTDSFGWTNNESLQQHDVQELNRILFAAIEQSLVNTKQSDLIQRLYRGTIINKLHCLNCNQIKQREEEFLDLPITIQHSESLHTSLLLQYLDRENLNGNNQYKCENCSKYVDAEKYCQLKHLPPILTFSLLRFTYDMKTWQRIKILDKFEFPLELDLSDYLEDEFKTKVSQDYSLYELFSIIIHSGSAYGGHYHTFIRDVQSIGTWLSNDNEHSIKKSSQELMPTQAQTEIYLIKESLDDENLDYLNYETPKELLKAFLYEKFKYAFVRIDTLCSEFSKQTGMTWNKQFKPKFGPINKFFKKYDESFEVNQDETQVKLKPHQRVNNILSHEYENLIKEKQLQTVCDGSCSVENNDQVSCSGNQIPQKGACWFDFDDSRVKPIETNQIQTQFSGKESAYMLFYRRKSSNSFRSPSIPQWLESEIHILNENLVNEREKHDKELNQVCFSVYLELDFYFTDKTPLTVENLIFLYDENELKKQAKLRIDKRNKKLSELKEEIINFYTMHMDDITKNENHTSEARRNEILNYLLSNDNISYYICKQTSQNLLFVSGKIVTNEELCEFLKSCSPTDSLILTSSKQIQTKLQVGFSHEPIRLRIKYLDTKLMQIESNDVVVTKTTRISIIKEIIASNFCLNNEKSFTMITANKEHKFSLLDNFQNEKQLSDFSFKAGDQIIVDNYDTNTLMCTPVKSKEDEIKINILNCVPSSASISSLQSLIINKSDTMDSVKIQILSLLNLDLSTNDECHLRYYDLAETCCRTLEAAIESLANEMKKFGRIHSGFVLSDTEQVDKLLTKFETYYIENSFLFLLCPGRAPLASNEINLKIHQNEEILAEILADREMQVKVLLDLLYTQLKFDEEKREKHYLKTINWLGDPDKILNALDRPLSEYNLENNSCLALVHGQLIPLGSTKLNIWKYKKPVQNQEDIHEFIVKNFIDIQNGTYKEKFEFYASFVVKSDMKLEDVKLKLSDSTNESPFRLRILKRQLIKNKNIEVMILKKNLIETHKTLSQLNFQTNEIDLCLQLMEDPNENLNQGILILDCAQFDLNSKRYKSFKEIHWNVNNGATLASLKASIVKEFELEQSASFQMQIAKRLVDKHDWQLIKDMCSSMNEAIKSNKNKKNKSGKSGNQELNTGKSNLKQAPYLMDDGNLIVFSLNELNRVLINRDFFSEFDQQYHEKLKKSMRNVDFFAQTDEKHTKQPRNRRQEVGITIRTDVF